jgi:hypothetical protein
VAAAVAEVSSAVSGLGQSQGMRTASSTRSATKLSEDETKAAWLARLDAPTWGTAASALMDVAGSAAAQALLQARCDLGDDDACETLSTEEESKAAWLAKLDAPTWGAVSKAVAAVASEVSAAPTMGAQDIAKHAWSPASTSSEDAAKAAWLAKIDK